MNRKAKRLLKIIIFVVIYLLLASLYTRVLTTNNTEAKLVHELLAKKYYGEVVEVRGGRNNVGWVKPVNITLWIGFGGWAPYPSGENLSVLPFPFFAEECVISFYEDDESWEGGTIRIRGKASDGRVLYEYSGRQSGQTPCPSGTLFFGKKEGAR